MKNHLICLLIAVCCYASSMAQQSQLYLDKNQSAFVHLYDTFKRTHKDGSTPSSYNEAAVFFKLRAQNELAALSPMNVLKSELDKASNILRVDIPNPSKRFNKHIGLNGQITVDFFASDYQLPYALNEPYYMRVQATPKISFLGLPFQTDFYYTTESNTYYNANGVTFRFDVEAFKGNVEKVAIDQLDAKKDDVKQLRYLKEDIDIYKNDISRSIANIQQEISVDLEAHKKTYTDHVPDLDSFGQDASNTVGSKSLKYRSKLDSISNQAYNKQNTSDSINQKIEYLRAKKDALFRYLVIADSLKQKVTAVEKSLNKTVASESLRLQAQAQNKHNKTQRNLMDSLKNSKVGQFIQTVEEFDMGITNPYLSASTINSIPIKGIALKKVSKHTNNYYTRLVAGKTITSFTTGLETQESQTLFDRNVLGAKIGFGSEYASNYYLISALIWDGKNSAQPASNLLTGIGWENQLGKLLYELEVTHSIYNNGWQQVNNENQVQSFTKLTDGLSYRGKLKYNVSKSSKIQFTADQKNYGFRSMGSPFLRNDYRSLEGKYTQKWLNGKIRSSTFYKHFQGNISNFSENTSHLKGFGINANTNFRKYPNLMLAYIPFEQGNNHQDTLFRTNNTFKTILAQLTYQRTAQGYSLYSMVGINQSIVEYVNDNVRSNTTLISFNQLYRTNKLSASLTVNRSLTNPTIDTLNYSAIISSITYNLKGIHLLASTNYKRTDAYGLFLTQRIGLRKKLSKSFIVTSTGSFGYINDIWGFENKKIRSVQLSLNYLW